MTRENVRLATLLESISESTTACLVTMVQGNLLALTLGHLYVASQTGVASGAITLVAIAVTRPSSRWVTPAVLGLATTVIDYFVHRGRFELVVLEALLTGLFAALLSYTVGSLARFVRMRYFGVAPKNTFQQAGEE